MPDKEREEKSLGLFLEYYNSVTGKRYIKDCRPEERGDIVGNYDFLCKDEGLKGVDLAIEEKSLNKSTENVRDNKEISKIIAEVRRILNGKGIMCDDKEYRFLLEFKNVPSIEERDKYAQKIAGSVENTIADNRGFDICCQVTLDTEGYDCIKRFRLIRARKGKGFFLFSCPESSESIAVEADTSDRMAKIFENSNRKLFLPKREGKKTILLITNDWNNFILADEHNIRDALELLGEQSHEYIDEIFFVNKRNFEDGFDIHKVK
jgi:hypothetical protein